MILKGIEKGDITDSLAKACKDGSDDKSNPDVVALEQAKLSEKQLLTFVINLQVLELCVNCFPPSLCAGSREDQTGSSEDFNSEMTAGIRGM